MNAELKGVHSPDIQELEKYIPENPNKFSFLLEIMVDPQGQEGEESFGIDVCTPKWLEETYKVEDIIIGHHHLIVREYNYEMIIQKIRGFLRHCSGRNWSEVAMKVSRLGRWEFEDY